MDNSNHTDDPCDDWSAAIMIRWTPTLDKRTRPHHYRSPPINIDNFDWTPVAMDYPPPRCIPIEPITGPHKIKGVIVNVDHMATREQAERAAHTNMIAALYSAPCRFCGGRNGRHAITCPNEALTR